MTSTDTFVLFHGAGTGAWIWERVRQALPAPSVAIDLPSRHPDATPDTVADAVVDRLSGDGLESVTLVLHSLSGVLASGLDERLGPRLQRIVYVSAVVPPAGGSFLDTLGVMQRTVLRLLFAVNRTGLKPSEAMIRRSLCNDLSAEDADRVVTRYEPEMPGLYVTPVGAPPEPSDSLYLRLTKDMSVTPAQQDAIIARLPRCRAQNIDAGHLAMLSQPEFLARALMQALD
ncbi:MAG: alpha/beta fold hydrolase [Bacteroidetes bacterium]|nr:alpha/beta fold hydrolase [Bacteroidota bacterium]